MARRPAKFEARRDLAWVAGGFLALQLGLAFAVETRLPQFRDPAYHHKLTRLERLRGGSESPPRTVVFLGSSRTGFGVQAGKLSEELSTTEDRTVCFNFGMPGTGPVMQALSLRRMLDDGVRPDAVFVEIVPMFLAGQPSAGKETDRFPVPRFRHAELDDLDRYADTGGQIRRDWWASWPTSWHSHRFEILSEVLPSWVPLSLRQNWSAGNDPHGWGTVVDIRRTEEMHRQAVESQRKTYFGYFHEFQLGGPACMALRDTLQMCRDHRIPAALYLMPEAAEFRSWYPPAMTDEINRFVRDIATEFGVLVIDARTWIEDQEFSDGHHLLATGAAQFTQRLAREPAFRTFVGAGERISLMADRP